MKLENLERYNKNTITWNLYKHFYEKKGPTNINTVNQGREHLRPSLRRPRFLKLKKKNTYITQTGNSDQAEDISSSAERIQINMVN